MDELFNVLSLTNMLSLYNILVKVNVESLANVTTFVFTFFVVGIFGFKFFNQPKYPIALFEKERERQSVPALDPVLPKQLTYRYRYNLFLMLFVISIELFHFTLAFNLPQIFPNNGNRINSFGYCAMLSALLIIGLLPNLEFVSLLLEKLRTFFHERAKIPDKGQELFQNLESREISYSTETVNHLLEHAEWNPATNNSAGTSHRLLKQEDFSIEVKNTTCAKWAKLTYLLYIIEKWSDRDFCKAHISNKELGWNAIKRDYTQIKEKAIKGDDVSTETDILLSKTYRLIGCLLFMADRSCTRIYDCLEEIGYPPTDPPFYGIPFQQLALTSVFTGGAIIMGALISIIISLKINDISPKSVNMNKTILIGTAYAVPLLISPTITVLIIKRLLSLFSSCWPLATPQSPRYKTFSERPWHIYVIVSLLGYVTGYLTLMALDAGSSPFPLIETMKKAVAETSVSPTAVYAYWSIVALVTAAFVAFRIDSHRNEPENKNHRMLLAINGCLLQIAMMMAAVYIAFIGVFNDGKPYYPCLDQSATSADIRKLTFFIVCAAMAVFIAPALFFTSRFNTSVFDRREDKRKDANDPIVLYYGEEKLEGIRINRSKNGALVEIIDFPQDYSGQFLIQIDDKPPIAVKVVAVNGKKIHLQLLENT